MTSQSIISAVNILPLNCFVTFITNRKNWNTHSHYLNGKPLKTVFISNIKDIEIFQNRVKSINLLDYNWLIYAMENSSSEKNIIEQRSYDFS